MFKDGHNLQNPVLFVFGQVKQCVSTWLADQKVTFPKMERFIDWVFPSGDKVKVNTDKASKGNLGLAGDEGMIRDSTGSWLTGFVVNLDFYSSFW